MKYALLIYGNDQAWADMDETEQARIHAGHVAFGKILGERDAIRSGEELERATTATTVRRKDGDFVLTDGPYAETAEQIGGFYIIEAADIDEAIAYAKALPEDIIEVRPVVDNQPS